MTEDDHTVREQSLKDDAASVRADLEREKKAHAESLRTIEGLRRDRTRLRGLLRRWLAFRGSEMRTIQVRDSDGRRLAADTRDALPTTGRKP